MKKETAKEVITAGKTHRTGWYFTKDKTFTIPVLLAVGRYSEAQNELCGALAKVAHFRNVPKTIREIPSDDPGVNDDYCIGTPCTPRVIRVTGRARCSSSSTRSQTNTGLSWLLRSRIT